MCVRMVSKQKAPQKDQGIENTKEKQDRASADYPGFSVSSAADLWLPSFVQEPHICVPGLAFAS